MPILQIRILITLMIPTLTLTDHSLKPYPSMVRFQSLVLQLEASPCLLQNHVLYLKMFLLQYPLRKLETMLSDMLDSDLLSQVQPVISSINAGKPKGPSAKLLSKLWLVSESLAKGALEHNTQLCRHSADIVQTIICLDNFQQMTKCYSIDDCKVPSSCFTFSN